MAKFNIEVELDWMEEDSYSIDEELKERIIEGVEDALLQKATHEALKMVDAKIAEKVKESEETINKAINKFIENVCSEKINNIQIPEKSSDWSDKITYYSLSEYVGMQFESFITQKRYDKDRRQSSLSERSGWRKGHRISGKGHRAGGRCRRI